MQDSLSAITRPHYFWADFYKQHRQSFISKINVWLTEGKEYVSFVVPTARLNFFFTPTIYDKPCICLHVLCNSFTVLHHFRQAFDLAKRFVDTCYLTLYYLHQAKAAGKQFEVRKFDWIGFAEWRKRYKAKGKTVQSILSFIRPTEPLYF